MSKVQCPICDAAMPAPWMEYPEYPFCSKRCRTIDLGRWLGESYKVDAGDRDQSTPGEDGSSSSR